MEKKERGSTPRKGFVSDRQFGSRQERDLQASRADHRDLAACQRDLASATAGVADQYGIRLKPDRTRRRRARSSRSSITRESTDLTGDDTTTQRMVNAAISPGQKFVTRSILVTISNRSRMLLAQNFDECPIECPSIVHSLSSGTPGQFTPSARDSIKASRLGF
jgi:hypothetical protein